AQHPHDPRHEQQPERLGEREPAPRQAGEGNRDQRRRRQPQYLDQHEEAQRRGHRLPETLMSAPVVTTFERVSELPLTIEEYSLEGRERAVNPEFTRVTTTYHLRGAGEEGLGEDVTYDPDEQREQLARGPSLPLAGEWTFGEFARHVGELDLFPAGAPDMPAFLLYRRWAIESAALDLALRQAGRSLGDVVGREHRPVSFVVSLRLGNPPSFAPVANRLEVYPWLRFKLDATPDWPGDLIELLVETGAIASLDFKGAYKGTAVDVETDPGFYRRIA